MMPTSTEALIEQYLGPDPDASDLALTQLAALGAEASRALRAEATRHGWLRGERGVAGWLVRLHLRQTAREIEASA